MIISKGFKIATILVFYSIFFYSIQQERPPPIPPSRPYTVIGGKKITFPQSRVMKIAFPGELYYPIMIRGYSTTTWSEFYPILTPHTLEWTKMYILHTIYPLSHDLSWTFY